MLNDLKEFFTESPSNRVVLKAQRLAAKGRTDQAIQLIEDAIERQGESAEMRRELATLYLSTGRPKQAGESLRALLKAFPGEVSEINEYLDWAQMQFNDIGPLHEALAEGHIGRRDFAAAITSLERVDSESLKRSLQSRLANLNRFLETSKNVPKSAVSTLYFSSLGYEVVNDWQKAIDGYRKILTAAPDEFQVVEERLRTLVSKHYRLVPLRLAFAEVLEGLGKSDLALTEYMATLDIDSRTATQVGRFIDGRLEANPGDTDLLWARTIAFVREKRTGDALGVCEKLIDAEARLDEVERLLADVRKEDHGNEWARMLTARLAMRKGNADVAINAAIWSSEEEPGPRAIEMIEQINEAFPDEPRPYQVLAEYRLRKGETDRGIETLRQLRRVDPGSGSTIASRLQAVLTAEPENLNVLEFLEEISLEGNDSTSAVPFLRKRLRRGHAEAREVVQKLRPMLHANAGDPVVKMAAIEAHLAAGEPSEAWGHLQDLIAGDGPVEAGLLHLMVLCAGSSPDQWRQVRTFVEARGKAFAGRHEMVFALAEGAGRAGLLREAVDRFGMLAGARPSAAPIVHAAIRSLSKDGSVSEPEDRVALAEALLDAGDVDGAIEVMRDAGNLPTPCAGRLADKFLAALRRDQENVSLRAGLAQVWLSTGQVARAMEAAREGLSNRQDAASAPLALIYADAASRNGKLREATRAYAAAVKRDSGLTSQAIAGLRRLIKIDLGLETAHLALGRLLVNQGEVSEGVNSMMTAWSIKADLGEVVLKDLDRTAERYPSEPSVDFARSRLYLGEADPVAAARSIGSHIDGDTGRLDEILTRLEGIAARYPRCAQVQLELGRAYARKGWAVRSCTCLKTAYELSTDLAEAIQVPLSKLQEDFPTEPDVHLTRGAIHEGEGSVVPAAEAYFKAADLGGPRGGVALEHLRLLCAEGGAAKALDASAAIQLYRARACRAMGEIGEAVDACRTVLNSGAGMEDEVRRVLDCLVEEYPENAQVRMGRALCLMRVQEFEPAVADLSRALTLDSQEAERISTLARGIVDRRPEHVAASRVLADALHASGDTLQAAQVLDASLATTAGGGDVETILSRRTLALLLEDEQTARGMLGRAESVTEGRDHLLSMLHREALSRSAAGQPPYGQPVLNTIARGDYLAACEQVTRLEPSPLKAWVLDRSGRHAEAAAVLSEILSEKGMTVSYAAIHDRIVTDQLEGRAHALTAEAPLVFGTVVPGEDNRSEQEEAQGAAEGGAE